MSSIRATRHSVSAATVQTAPLSRPIVHRTRGQGYGEVFRLMSPRGLGQDLKPFVLLDSFAGDMSEFSAASGLHPHSGVATVTVFTRGDVCFDNPEIGHGHIAYGGAEWMCAGIGAWHGKELFPGRSEGVHGFELWLALPPDAELSEPEIKYVEACAAAHAGPANVILGTHEGVTGPVKAPGGVNYLLVTLSPRERWTYLPPERHTIGWVALSRGSLIGASAASSGELLIFADSDGPISLRAGPHGATFVLGSAVPHPHDLHLGPHSVHTSAEAMAAGELRIAELRRTLFPSGSR